MENRNIEELANNFVFRFNVNRNEEIKELSKYSIDDIIYALDNFEDDYWKNQNYDEWRNTIWSCRWFSDLLNDEDDVIYNKVMTKCKLYPGGITKKQFGQIWYDYDNNTYREEIEEIKLYNNNCNMKFMKQLLKEKQRINLVIEHYLYLKK